MKDSPKSHSKAVYPMFFIQSGTVSSLITMIRQKQKDEIDFKNELLPDQYDIEQEAAKKEEDKPLFTSQVLEDLQMLLAVFLILLLTVLVIILKVKLETVSVT